MEEFYPDHWYTHKMCGLLASRRDRRVAQLEKSGWWKESEQRLSVKISSASCRVEVFQYRNGLTAIWKRDRLPHTIQAHAKVEV